LLRQDRAKAVKEAEALFERAAEQYGGVKVPYGDTVGVKAKAELHEIRHLSVGGDVQEVEGPDQDGKRFKLSDYKGKVVLLYFWSQY
jgi:cytochrome oxidase Cu insertion factor (SCO1/SenC/PrrC family)